MPAPPIIVREHEDVDAPAELIVGGRLDVYPAVANKDYFQPKISTTGLKIQARGWVGVIPLNDEFTLHVTPRVPINNMARLLSTINHTPRVLPGLLRTYETQTGIYPSLIALYAASIRTEVERISLRGLLRRYERREQDLAPPRGRIAVSRTVQKSLPRNSPYVSTSYFERTTDIPENRTLLAAVAWLAHFAARNSATLPVKERRTILRDLNATGHLLNGVGTDPRQRFLKDPVVTGHRSLPADRRDYRGALDLALTILGQQAVVIDRPGGRMQMESLLIKMDDVFEDYLREVLRRTAIRDAWPVEVLNGNNPPPGGAKSTVFPAQSDDSVETKPDIILRRLNVTPKSNAVAIDVKYKAAGKQVDRQYLEQVFTYGLAYGATTLVIMQPYGSKGGKAGLRRVGTVGGFTVYVYAIDLAADLDVEEANLCKEMLALI